MRRERRVHEVDLGAAAHGPDVDLAGDRLAIDRRVDPLAPHGEREAGAVEDAAGDVEIAVVGEEGVHVGRRRAEIDAAERERRRADDDEADAGAVDGSDRGERLLERGHRRLSATRTYSCARSVVQGSVEPSARSRA
jgi:hypothetical protein